LRSPDLEIIINLTKNSRKTKTWVICIIVNLNWIRATPVFLNRRNTNCFQNLSRSSRCLFLSRNASWTTEHNLLLMKYISSPFSIAPLQMYCKNNLHSSSSLANQIILFNLIIDLKNIQNYRGNNRHLLFSLDSYTAWSNLSHLFLKIIIIFWN